MCTQGQTPVSAGGSGGTATHGEDVAAQHGSAGRTSAAANNAGSEPLSPVSHRLAEKLGVALGGAMKEVLPENISDEHLGQLHAAFIKDDTSMGHKSVCHGIVEAATLAGTSVARAKMSFYILYTPPSEFT